MQTRILPLLVIGVAGAIGATVLAQSERPRHFTKSTQRVHMIEISVKQAREEFAEAKKGYERDLAIVRHLQRADEALADPMQPAAAIQKAFEEVSEAERLDAADRYVRQGVLRMRQILEEARRSPGSADFGRLRSLLMDEALGPAMRLALRNGTALQDEVDAWLGLQQQVTDHLRALSELTAESLRVSVE